MNKEKFNEVFETTARQVCEEVLDMKKTYFSTAGKSGWKPLTKGTLKTKKAKFPENATKFNVQTGRLRDSILVTWSLIPGGIRFYARLQDDPRNLEEYLCKTLGRDFLDIDEKEQELINTRFKELFNENWGS